MKWKKQLAGFTLIELLVTLTMVGVFLVILAEFICIETRICQETECLLCIEGEERYVSEFLFESLYTVEKIEVNGGEEPLLMENFDFSYIDNACPILGSHGGNTIRFVQEGTQLQIWDMENGYPQIKKTIAYHVVDARCEIIQSDYKDDIPLLHVNLTFEAGLLKKDYDLLFAMRNLS